MKKRLDELMAPTPSLTKVSGTSYQFLMQDDATYTVEFEQQMDHWQMLLKRKKGKKTQTAGNDEPVKNPVKGYSKEVYDHMFEALFEFLRDQGPQRVYYIPSNKKQKEEYLSRLVANEGQLKAIGYDAEFDEQAGMFIVTPFVDEPYVAAD